MNPEKYEQTVLVFDKQKEITIEDLEFNLENHKDCDYADNIYEFLFNFEKGLNPPFLTLSNKTHEKSSKRKLKTQPPNKKFLLNTVNFSEIRSSVCLKLPTRKKNILKSMHSGKFPLSPDRINVNLQLSPKLLEKGPNNLLFFNKTSKISPYLCLSPRVKNVVIRSPRSYGKSLIKK
jgi:hypothetical protein